MPLVLGLASSHAPSMFLPPEKWQQFYPLLTRGLPQPPSAERETATVIEEFVSRIDQAFAVLRAKIAAARPDVLVMVGDDQGEVFSDQCMPNLAVFTGEACSGSCNLDQLGEPLDANHIVLQGHPAVAEQIVAGLVEAGFQPAVIRRLVATGKPAGGIGHAFTRPARALGVEALQLPVVPIFLNAYHPPLMSARHCLELGKTLARIAERLPERIAVYGSGGLSHDPRGPRAGWVDEPLDRWVLGRIAAGDHEALANLFTIDSDTLRSGTGEIRSWVVVAGAFAGVRASVVDYFVAHHAVTGIGFAVWPADSGLPHR
ncbi:MAG: hypothetical protein K6U87_05140 [Firmicutes bacterium]|nr:hypothetical protein [Bacillota bacterium]